MIAFVDVHYRETDATAACVLADRWDASAPVDAWSCLVSPIAPYEPGAFFKRELPCLLEVLRRAPTPGCVVIDGYVWLDAQRTPGLGARLHEALGGVPVIGLAKTAWKGSDFAVRVARPGSVKPLFLTCIGVDEAAALADVATLHGAHRLPTLVKAVDGLARRPRQWSAVVESS
ncbi:MAG: endonuclease V [Myxococcaceae bacterium]|nr:endonuclease V [Myxococcaceae bacterium]